jgi:hypothetical protein
MQLWEPDPRAKNWPDGLDCFPEWLSSALGIAARFVGRGQVVGRERPRTAAAGTPGARRWEIVCLRALRELVMSRRAVEMTTAGLRHLRATTGALIVRKVAGAPLIFDNAGARLGPRTLLVFNSFDVKE